MFSMIDIMKQAEELGPMVQDVARDFKRLQETVTRIETKLDLILSEKAEAETAQSIPQLEFEDSENGREL